MSDAPHLRLRLAPAWSHHVAADFSGFVPDTEWHELKYRAALNIEVGPVRVSLDPTAAELRQLAHMCTALADRLEVVPVLEAA